MLNTAHSGHERLYRHLSASLKTLGLGSLCGGEFAYLTGSRKGEVGSCKMEVRTLEDSADSIRQGFPKH